MKLFLGSMRIRPAAAVAPTTVQETFAPSHGPVTLRLRCVPFTAVWIVFVCVSTLNALLATIFAAVYYAAMTIRNGYMLDAVGLLPAEDVSIIVVCYSLLALFFWKTAIQAIVVSIRSRRLLLQAMPTHSAGQPPTFWQRIRRDWGSKAPNMFETVFLLRELLEVSTQSYQAYKSSKLISEQWINNFYVITLALNCWISPLIHIRTYHHPALQRFLYVSCDVVLDFASTAVIPMCIIFSVVVAAFTANLSMSSGDMDYAYDVPMDEVYFINLVKAVQQVFAVTYFDFATKILPFISMANCLGQISKIVRPHSSTNDTPHCGTCDTIQCPQLRVHSKLRPAHAGSSSAVERVQLSAPRSLWSRVLSLVVSTHTVHALLAVWGVCVVGFHTQAGFVSSDSATLSSLGCKSSSHPWFMDQVSCTILEINCNRRGIVGHADEIAAALNDFEAQGVSCLILSHCPQLHVPAQIHTLTNLMWFEIYNATLYVWGDDAALVGSMLPRLQYLNVLFVDMPTFPQGLQSADFPSKLRDITIVGSNLTTLPSDLHTKWKRPVNLVLERNDFQHVPPTLARMNPERLSLLGNRIVSIPDDFFLSTAHFSIFSVAENPIATLPSYLGGLEELYLVLIDYTEILQLPAWLVDEGQRRAASKRQSITISGGGSRFCRESDAMTRSTAALPGLLVVCREKMDQEIEAYASTLFRTLRQP